MKKLFGKKSSSDGNGSEEPQRAGLFGRKQAATGSNPYATESAQDPYRPQSAAPSYTTLPGTGPPTASHAGYGNSPVYSSRQPSAPGPQANSGYGSTGRDPTGYGGARFDNTAPNAYNPTPNAGMASGYPPRAGNLSNAPQPPSMEARNQLMGAPASRQQAPAYGESAMGGSETANGYGMARELTPQEQEEEDMKVAKGEVKGWLRAGNDSANRSLAIVRNLQQQGDSLEGRVDHQGERLIYVEKGTDAVAQQERIAGQKTKQLRALQGWTGGNSKKYESKAAQQRIEAELQEKDRGQNTAALAARERAEADNAARAASKPTLLGKSRKIGDAERKLYVLEDSDGEQEEMLNEGEETLGLVHEGVVALKQQQYRIANKINTQNKRLDRLNEKTDDSITNIIKHRNNLETIN